MNWSDYSRFVGDIFGAPLAIEGLLAFFLESTFLGLWIFGWDRLPPKLHAGLHLDRPRRHPALGVLHPGRQLLDAAPGRLRLQPGHRPGRAERLRRRAAQQGAAGDVPARRARGVHDRRRVRGRRRVLAPGPGRPPTRTARCTAGRCAPAPRWCWSPASAWPSPGDVQGKIMTEVQPMKMAAAEALYDDRGAGVVLAPHHRQPRRQRGEVRASRCPGLLSFLATGTLTAGSWASTSSARSTRRSTAATRVRLLLRRRLHARSSR